MREIKKISLSIVVVMGINFTTSCSGFNYEKGGNIIGSIGGVGSGYYLCQNSGFGNKFGIGCMVLGGLVGGVLGGEIGESFDNKEIYHTINECGEGCEKSFNNGSEKMDVKIVDDYFDKRESWDGGEYNVWCKDFEFEVEKDGSYERGRGKSCKDNEGNWKVLGIDLVR